MHRDGDGAQKQKPHIRMSNNGFEAHAAKFSPLLNRTNHVDLAVSFEKCERCRCGIRIRKDGLVFIHILTDVSVSPGKVDRMVRARVLEAPSLRCLSFGLSSLHSTRPPLQERARRWDVDILRGNTDKTHVPPSPEMIRRLGKLSSRCIKGFMILRMSGGTVGLTE